MHTLLIEDNQGGSTELFGHEAVLCAALEEWVDWYAAPEMNQPMNAILRVSSYSNNADRAEVLFVIPMASVLAMTLSS